MNKDRENTEWRLLDAVGKIIEEEGFEGLKVNLVARKAGVSKMLIYRYFGSMDRLITAYVGQHDFWINFQTKISGQIELSEFVKGLFKQQILVMREDFILKRLHRWELSQDNEITKNLRDKREHKGIWLVEFVSKLSGYPQEKIAVFATLISSAITYLTLLEENCKTYNGIPLRETEGWEQIEKGINELIDIVFGK
ncbi:MAG TPA: TetR/AcrR family transcriptional regulator [Candidatus Avirikenella pullistercoris]|nr:TetR/AcrR family transcriptional regulator [Candidatus Avirikenella pullistercoris]